jgi:hypothetical protein
MTKFGEEEDRQTLALVPGKKARRGKRLYICECGNTCWIRPNNVNSNRVKSCGCLRKTGKSARKARQSAISMKGKTFGKLTVIGRSAPPKTVTKKTGAYWFCKCTCGKIKTVYGGSLRSGKTKSCGECKGATK